MFCDPSSVLSSLFDNSAPRSYFKANICIPKSDLFFVPNKIICSSFLGYMLQNDPFRTCQNSNFDDPSSVSEPSGLKSTVFILSFFMAKGYLNCPVRNQRFYFSRNRRVDLENVYFDAAIIRRGLTKSTPVEGLRPGLDKENPGP